MPPLTSGFIVVTFVRLHHLTKHMQLSMTHVVHRVGIAGKGHSVELEI